MIRDVFALARQTLGRVLRQELCTVPDLHNLDECLFRGMPREGVDFGGYTDQQIRQAIGDALAKVNKVVVTLPELEQKKEKDDSASSTPAAMDNTTT